MKEKRGNFRIQICMAQVVLLLVISGCSHTHTQDGNTGTKKIANLCLDLFEKAAEENRNDDLEMIRTIINRFGENGYSAVDSKDRYDGERAGRSILPNGGREENSGNNID